MSTDQVGEHRHEKLQGDTSGSAFTDKQLRPDVALALWMFWMESNFGNAQDWTGNAKTWREMMPGDLAGNMLAAGSRQLNEILAHDPLLRSIDQMWNTNPFREIVPVDWAEIARALRTVWMMSIARPGESLQSATELNSKLWHSAIDSWNEAG